MLTVCYEARGMNKITDEQVKLITEIGNTIVGLKGYQIPLQEWQVRYTLLAILVINEYNKVKKWLLWDVLNVERLYLSKGDVI